MHLPPHIKYVTTLPREVKKLSFVKHYKSDIMCDKN